ncbi:hypothetical protein QE152_g40306 [Popillia japonica]|uniref:Uncharacterized protein n=1 Tax=Popillia japonica TaxID=7064 RepID=A0AAW1HRA9_POPJA
MHGIMGLLSKLLINHYYTTFQTGLFSSNISTEVMAVTTEEDLENILDCESQQSSNLTKNLDNNNEVTEVNDIPNPIAEQNFVEKDHKVLIDIIHDQNISLKTTETTKEI